MIVVIPSSRNINLHYLTPLIDAGARFIIVDDTEGTIRIDHPQFSVYNWSDRRRILGDLDVGIPRRNGACRDFGFFIAWRESAKEEVILAIDDDCMVEELDFAEQVEGALTRKLRPIARGTGSHFNVLNLYRGIGPGPLYPRGFPYSARVGYVEWDFDERVTGTVSFNLGLWKGVFDVNAIDKLKASQWTFRNAELVSDSVVVPPGVLVSVCSMNMQFRRALIPAVYQLPMHIEVAPGWVIDRYGDIWGGFVLKSLMDIRGDQMSVGRPMIRHVKEGGFDHNIWQEHLCHLVNDEFIDLLRNACTNIRPDSYLAMMDNVREEFARRAPNSSPILRAYLLHLTSAMGAWLKALRMQGSAARAHGFSA